MLVVVLANHSVVILERDVPVNGGEMLTLRKFLVLLLAHRFVQQVDALLIQGSGKKVSLVLSIALALSRRLLWNSKV